jgi:hypothetical protein
LFICRNSTNLGNQYGRISSVEKISTSSSQGSRTHHPPYSCEVCHQVFPNERTLLAHSSTHDNEKSNSHSTIEYACNICDRTFEQPKSLKMHSIKYHKIKLTDASPHRQEHKPASDVITDIKKEALNDLQVECNICFQVFENVNVLEEHFDTSHKDISSLPKENEETSFAKPECVYCFQTFKNNSGLVNHLRTAHGKPSCNMCLEIFNTQEELLRHRNTVHKGSDYHVSSTPSPTSNKANEESTSFETPQEHTCEKCGKSFEKFISFVRHKAYHTKMGPDWIPSEMVVNESADVPPLAPPPAPPQPPASPPVPYTCNKCGKSFDRHISFIRHKAWHVKMGRKWSPLENAATQQASSSVSSTNKPVSQQTEESENDTEEFQDAEYKPSRSTVSKLPARSRLLKNNGTAPFCLYCKKIYENFKKLWDHICKVHPSKERYKCPQHACNRVFFTKNGYRSHLTAHKNKESIAVKLSEYSSSSPSTPSTPPSSVPSPTVQGDSNVCVYCFKQFSSRGNVARHILEHHTTNATTLKCKKCPRSFTRNDLLLRHELSHKNQQEEITSESASVRTRVLVYPRVLCRYCPKVLSKKYLPDHERNHRRAGDKPMVRNKTTVKNLNEELAIDKELMTSASTTSPPPPPDIVKKKKPVCRYCTAQPSTHEELRTHLANKHAGKAYFLCSSCPEVYYDRMGLKSHTSCHSRNYTSCKHCNRKFAYLLKRVKHERICPHRAPRQKAAKTNNTNNINATTSAPPAPVVLQQPKLETSSSPIYTCDFCGAQFLETQSFVKHLQSHARA